MKFKIGDKVKVKWATNSNVYDKTATIKDYDGKNWYSLQFDDYIYGHDCDGTVPFGYGYFLTEGSFKLIEKPKSEVYFIRTFPSSLKTEVNDKDGNCVYPMNIVCSNAEIKIVVNDRTTIAILPNGEKIITKCHPDDEFDVEKGIAITLNRVMINALEKDIKKMSRRSN